MSIIREHASAGFTVVELLVVVAIMVLTTGVGIAAYVNFNDRSTLTSAGADVQNLFRTAQKKARVGDKPAGCGHLQSYSVKINSGNGANVVLSAVCDNATYAAQTYALPSIVSVSPAKTVSFFVLSGGVQNPNTYVVSNGKQTYSFDVDAGGSIGDPTVQ